MFTRIHRRSEKTTPLSEDYDASGSDSSFKSAPSPAAKRRATKRLSVTKYPRKLVRRFHLDRQSLGKKMTLRTLMEEESKVSKQSVTPNQIRQRQHGHHFLKSLLKLILPKATIYISLLIALPVSIEIAKMSFDENLGCIEPN